MEYTPNCGGCNRLDLQTLGSQPVMPKNLPDHWCKIPCLFDQATSRRRSDDLHAKLLLTSGNTIYYVLLYILHYLLSMWEFGRVPTNRSSPCGIVRGKSIFKARSEKQWSTLINLGAHLRVP